MDGLRNEPPRSNQFVFPPFKANRRAFLIEVKVRLGILVDCFHYFPDKYSLPLQRGNM